MGDNLKGIHMNTNVDYNIGDKMGNYMNIFHINTNMDDIGNNKTI